MTDLHQAIENIIAETEVVSEIREDPVIKKLIRMYLKAPFAQFDESTIEDELVDLSNRVAFDTQAFPIDALAGVKAAAKARMDLQAARDRLISLSRRLRSGLSKANKVLRVGQVYIRQGESLKKVSTAKHKDDIAYVALREIAESYESMKLLLDEVKETLSGIDDKSKVLDAWFLLHKQYVFMAGKRGPYGEQETHEEASSLGRRRKRKHT
jgi:hypothetical protein